MGSTQAHPDETKTQRPRPPSTDEVGQRLAGWVQVQDKLINTLSAAHGY